MDNQDKLHEQFKDAARKAETKDFARMEAVWNRVEEKLDHTELKKKASWWKYTGIAATLLLFMGAGFFILNNENNTPVTTPEARPENTVTVIDTQKVEETLNPATIENNEAVVTTVNPTTTEAPYAASPGAEPVAPEAQKKELSKGYTDAVTVVPPAKSSATVNRKMEITPVSANALVAYENTNAKVVEPTLFKSIKTVTGTITDSEGIPIPGVDVTVDGTDKKAQTDFDGIYTIDAKAGEKLVASYVGLESHVVTLGEKKDNVDFTMKDDTVALNDVVVEGYRTTTRAKSNEAANTITSKAIQGRPNANFAQTLQGQVPGLNVTTGAAQPQAIGFIGNNIFNTSPHATFIDSGNTLSATLKSKISIPPNKEPLFVVDGTPLSADQLDRLNLKEIVSVQVLNNDALLSLYGNRAYNSCIVIRTYEALSKKEKRQLDEKRKENNSAILKSIPFSPQDTPLVFVDDISVGYEGLQQIDSDHIYAIDVLKDSTATAPYGEEGRNGIIKISIKKQYAKKVHRQMIRFNKKQEKLRKKQSEKHIPFRQKEN